MSAALTDLRAVDRELGALLRRIDPATPPTVALAASLASLAVARGHAAFALADAHALVEADDALALPAPEAWEAELRTSRWVDVRDDDGVAAIDRPLVLERGHVYLRRYREYERRLAAGLQRLAASRQADAHAAVEPAQQRGLDPRQAEAVRSAGAHGLLLVTGGPGTGKTTTIARLLLHRLALRPGLRIALAAPTGRAAERMAESLRAARAGLEAAAGTALAAALDALPAEASTLHRLLGTVPDTPRFRHDAAHPLPFDVVVVDEASMVDLPLMCKLVEAVPDGAQLVLLGDRDQLPSVEAGDVLAGIDAAARDVAADASAATGDLFAPPPSPRPARVHLTRGFRHADSLQVAPLAAAVRDGDAARAIALLRGGALANVRFHADALDPLAGDAAEALLAPWRALRTLRDPAEALAQASRTRVLTALRDGPQGASGLNARIEERLAGAQRDAYFHGRLLLVTENSPRHGLFNGDLGVCMAGADGATVWFGGRDGPRGFHPGALPAHASAFAMTVHKAQGSEFDTVWLQLPRQDARPLSRELVYTAITRARAALHVAGPEAVLRAALSRHVQRVSGLRARLER